MKHTPTEDGQWGQSLMHSAAEAMRAGLFVVLSRAAGAQVSAARRTLGQGSPREHEAALIVELGRCIDAFNLGFADDDATRALLLGDMASCSECGGETRASVFNLPTGIMARCRECGLSTYHPLVMPGPTDREEGVLWADARLIALLRSRFPGNDKMTALADTLTKNAQRIASEIDDGKRSEGRAWGLWLRLEADDSITYPVLDALAEALWGSVVEPRFERKARWPLAAMPRVYSNAVLDLLNPNMAKEKAASLASIDGNVHRELRMQKGLKALRGKDGHRLFRWVWHTTHQRLIDTNNPERSLIFEFKGGYTHLAQVVGCKSRKAVTNLRHAIEVGGQVFIDVPDLRVTGLWTAVENKRTKTLTLSLSPIFSASRVWDQLDKGQDRHLVAASPLALLGPLVGRSNEHGPQLTLQMALQEEFCFHSRELVAEGSVQISNERFATLADQSGVTSRLLPEVKAALTSPGSPDLFPMIIRVDGDRYIPHDQTYLEFYRRQGQRRLARKKGGEKRAAQKRKFEVFNEKKQ